MKYKNFSSAFADMVIGWPADWRNTLPDGGVGLKYDGGLSDENIRDIRRFAKKHKLLDQIKIVELAPRDHYNGSVSKGKYSNTVIQIPYALLSFMPPEWEGEVEYTDKRFVNTRTSKMKKINENTKITLTIGQLKRLVKEASDSEKVTDADLPDGWTVRKLENYLKQFNYGRLLGFTGEEKPSDWTVLTLCGDEGIDEEVLCKVFNRLSDRMKKWAKKHNIKKPRSRVMHLPSQASDWYARPGFYSGD